MAVLSRTKPLEIYQLGVRDSIEVNFKVILKKFALSAALIDTEAALSDPALISAVYANEERTRCEVYNVAVLAYLARDFNKASTILRDYLNTGLPDHAAIIFSNEVEKLRKEPINDAMWDGVISLLAK